MMPQPVATTTEIGHGILAVDTAYLGPAIDASHLLVEAGRAAFIDTGTNHSVPLLLDALQQQDLATADVDYVFLTHVHLDHAGGAGELLRHLPNARAVIHPRGARHLVDPGKLVRGATAVYGEQRFRELFGGVTPIPAERLMVVDDMQEIELGGRPLQCLFTEGHARHHYCLWDPASSGVFTGDSFGVSYRELDTAQGEFIFPTTTPVDFDPPEAHKAIDRIMALAPQQLYLTHYSRVKNLARLADDMHQSIDFFTELAISKADEDKRKEAIEQGLFDYLAQRLSARGFIGDAGVLHAVLDFDVSLNAMGLDVWLQRKAQP